MCKEGALQYSKGHSSPGWSICENEAQLCWEIRENIRGAAVPHLYKNAVVMGTDFEFELPISTVCERDQFHNQHSAMVFS